MLTGKLLCYTRRKGRLMPRLLPPQDFTLLAAATQLLQLVEGMVGCRRGELERVLEHTPRELSSSRLTEKVLRGLAKLLLERCTFAPAITTQPQALRRQVFDAAAAAWRQRGAQALPQWHREVLQEAFAAQDLFLKPPHPSKRKEAGTGEEDLWHVLYADLPDNHLFSGLRSISPGDLLYRYNTAQLQGLLLCATGMVLRSPWPTPPRLRQLFRYLKFYGLLFAQQENEEEKELVLLVDGPLSVLESGSRYGLNLAQFLPVLFHWEASWRLECALRLKPGAAETELIITPHPHLKSHYPDQGQWVAEEVQRFMGDFNAAQSDWEAVPAEQLLTLPQNRFLIPDFQFHPLRGGTAPLYLEYLRYPSSAQLATRLTLIARYHLEDYLIACRDVPAIQTLKKEHPTRLLAYRRHLLPSQVLRVLEARAAAEPPQRRAPLKEQMQLSLAMDEKEKQTD